MMVLGILLTPAQPSQIEAESLPAYRVVSGALVDHPKQLKLKYPEPTSPGEECNCYAYVKNRLPDLGRMASTNPNSPPLVGSVAVEWFGDIKHISLVTAVDDDGVWVEESNYKRCEIGTRFIPFDKYSLVGFWSR